MWGINLWAKHLVELFPSWSARSLEDNLAPWLGISLAIIKRFSPQTSSNDVPESQLCARYPITLSSTTALRIRNMVDSAAEMVSQETLAASSAGLAIIIGLWLLQKIRRGKKHKLPPLVPGGVPLFGNAFQIPALQQGPWAKKLAEKYGEMFVFSLRIYLPCHSSAAKIFKGSLASSVPTRGFS